LGLVHSQAARRLVEQLGIFSRPDFDDTAIRWGTWWTAELIKKCPLQVVELYAEQARRAPNEAAIRAHPKAYYYGFGHGNRGVFTGQDFEAIMDYNNVDLWKEAWVHLLSCEVFADLGKLLGHGSGYEKTYYFYISTHPNSVAEQYFDSDHQYMLALWIKKVSRGEAQRILKDKYTEYYAQGRPGRDYLPWDRDAHVITGDPNEKPEPEPGIQSVEAQYRYQGEDWVAIDGMTRVDGDVWTLKWRIPKEGVCRLKYVAEDHEGNTKAKETGDFTIKFPESPIEIVPIWPVGGEVIEAKAAEIKTQVRYLG